MRFTILWILALVGSFGMMAQNVTRIKASDSIYMLKGKGGNIAVNFGDDGVLVIDSQFAEATPQVLATIRQLSDKPIQFLVNTHHHGDHVGGNENFNKEGAIIYAHDNVLKRIQQKDRQEASKAVEKAYQDGLEKAQKENMSEEEAGASAKRYASNIEKTFTFDYISPMITFSENSTFYYNGEQIMLIHVHNAHTDGDTMIYFTESNVIHTGDAYVKGKYPYVDTKNGGSLDGYIAGLEKVMLLADEETVIIPGHGSLASINDVKETHSMMKYLKDRVAYYYLTGKTLEEILPLEDVAKTFDDKGFGGGFISTESFINMVYEAAKKKYKNKRGKPNK
ncbi:MBL fold metallo-hydrolase [Aureisphaera galaxeae]|uniref:MBL fold metallo-hydrolase n=1 Tax=Aureisphaera galaxeae TaxID=1538023 RepID=UPI00235100F6|nr:MBL fold metallo-hydrolase [Aureisphaera galaxeae]MDC8005798.1 MBL fold metallo-hydrolase [Aureisphaera galaxeae]